MGETVAHLYGPTASQLGVPLLLYIWQLLCLVELGWLGSIALGVLAATALARLHAFGQMRLRNEPRGLADVAMRRMPQQAGLRMALVVCAAVALLLLYSTVPWLLQASLLFVLTDAVIDNWMASCLLKRLLWMKACAWIGSFVLPTEAALYTILNTHAARHLDVIKDRSQWLI